MNATTTTRVCHLDGKPATHYTDGIGRTDYCADHATGRVGAKPILVPVTIAAEDVTVGQRIRPNVPGAPGSVVVRVTRDATKTVVDLASIRLLLEGWTADEATSSVVEFPPSGGNLTTYVPADAPDVATDLFIVRNSASDAWYLSTGGTERRSTR